MSPSSLSLVRRHLFLYPLPLNPTDLTDTEEDSDPEEEEEETQLPTNIEIRRQEKQQQRRIEEEERLEKRIEQGRRRKDKKKRKKHQKQQQQLDSEEEDSRRPIPHSEEYLHSQKHQRISNHPRFDNMSGRGKKRSNSARISVGGSSRTNKHRKKNNDEVDCSEDEATANSTLASGSTSAASEKDQKQLEMEIRRKNLEKKLRDLEKEMLQEKKPGSKSAGSKTELEKSIETNAKHRLFKICKFTHNAKKPDEQYNRLEKDTCWVLNYMLPKEYREFEDFPDLQKEYREYWIMRYKDIVRKALNEKNNNIRSTILDVFAGVKDGADNWNPHGLPATGDEMAEVLFRKGMSAKAAGRDGKIQMLAAVTDILMPKVSDSEALGCNSDALWSKHKALD